MSYGLTAKRRQQRQRNSQCDAWPSPIGDVGWSASVLAHDGGQEGGWDGLRPSPDRRQPPLAFSKIV